MSRFTRPTPIAWLLFIGALVTTVGLGTWQVARLQWKENLIGTIEHARTEAPLTEAQLPTTEEGWKEKNFWPVKLTGTWDSMIEYHLAPRYYQSKLGYHLVQPLQLKDKRILLVNRGWIPADMKDIGLRPHSIGVGKETITGMIRYGDERNRFTPDNQMEKNVWFGRDVKAMADFYEVKNVQPAMIDLVGTVVKEKLPYPSDGAIRLRNDHLTYIITWYSIALSILVIFVLAHRKKA